MRGFTWIVAAREKEMSGWLGPDWLTYIYPNTYTVTMMQNQKYNYC